MTFLCVFVCVTGSWCSSSRTKYVWNSSREPPRTATPRPAGARTTTCWRCWCPRWHSGAPSPGLPVHSRVARLGPNPPPTHWPLVSRNVMPVPTMSPDMRVQLLDFFLFLFSSVTSDQIYNVTSVCNEKALLWVARSINSVEYFTGDL